MLQNDGINIRNMEATGKEEDDVADQAPKETPQCAELCDTGLKETDKKDLLWMGGVADCFSSVLSLFGRADLKTSKGEFGYIKVCASHSWNLALHSPRSLRYATLEGLIDFMGMLLHGVIVCKCNFLVFDALFGVSQVKWRIFIVM